MLAAAMALFSVQLSRPRRDRHLSNLLNFSTRSRLAPITGHQLRGNGQQAFGAQ